MSTRILKRIPRKSLMTQRKQPKRRGVAAVEFAIVAPVFLLLVIGMIELGRAMMVQQLLVNASRVGARRAITLSSTEQEVIDAVDEYAAGVGLDGIITSVSPNPATTPAGDSITVDVQVDYNEVSWLPAPWFMGGKQQTASSVMRKEGF